MSPCFNLNSWVDQIQNLISHSAGYNDDSLLNIQIFNHSLLNVESLTDG